MQTFFTHMPRPLRPPGRNTLSLLPALLLLLLPAWSMAQTTCFAGITAGSNVTYCEGEIATLDGGYLSYTGDATVGNPEVTWSVASGGTGTFTVDGVTQGDGSTATATNFSFTGNGFTGPIVIFTPDPGVTSVTLAITAVTGEAGCNTNETEQVILYFDPVNNVPIDADLNGTPVLDDADETSTNSITAETGDVLTLVIDETIAIDNGQQNEDIPLFNVTYGNAGGFLGLPPAGDYDQGVFDNTFDDLTLTSTSCDPATITMTVYTYYDRDESGDLSGAEECQGPSTTIDITVNPRPAPQTTIGAVDDILIVCEDDEDVEVVVTGTPFTKVTYTVSYDGGATVPNGPQTLDLDATGTSFDIMLDANDGVAGEDIVVTLIEQEFLSGPPCQVTIAKPLTIEVLPLPSLMLELVNPEDALLCNRENGGPNVIFYRVLTSSGDGVYSFTVTDFADGVAQGDVTFNNETFTGGVGPTLSFTMNGPFASPQLITLMVEGASITREDLAVPCTNDSPDASISWVVQPEVFAGLTAEVDDNGAEVLNNDSFNNTLDLLVCDEGNLSIDMDDLPAGFTAAAGTTAQLEVTVTNSDNVPGVPTSGVFDFDTNTFSFDGPLDIPNSQTDNSSITFTFTPYFEDNGSAGLDGDECNGETLTLNVSILPAPTVTVEVSEEEVCANETVIVTITASETGTASLILDQGGDPILIDVDVPSGDDFTGTYTSEELTALTMFTVTTFIGDDANCPATVNQMVMTDVEPLPEAAVAADVSVCDDEDATITFTGSAGNGTGFTFTYSVNGATPESVSTDGTDATADVTFEPGDLPAGESTITLVGVANNDGLKCPNDAEGSVTISIEDEPIVSCDADDALICSGDDYSFTLTAGNDEESALGNTLYYSVTTTVTTTVSTATGSTEETEESTEIVLGTAGDVTISGPTENMSGFNQTIEISATPFYADDSENEITEIGDACTGETVTCSVTVKTMPMVTFGGTEAVCEGDVAGVIFTGPPNGRASIEVRDEEGDVLLPFFPIFFDDGGTSLVLVPNAPATFEVVLTGVADGPVFGNPDVCLNEANFSFTVNVTPSPEAEFDEEGAEVCEGDNPVITLTGTPFAQVTIDSDNDANDQVVNLDENGEGSFTVTAGTDENFTIGLISITTEDGNGTDFTCTAEGDDGFELTVNPAPVGALVSNAVLCDGDSPEVQFNLTTLNDDLTGTFDIVVNGITFSDVINGEVLDFAGTAFATLSETTTFTLTSIVESDTELGCEDIINGDIFSVDVVVNPIPEVSVSSVPEVICSGSDLVITSTGMPMISENDNPLFYELILSNGVGEPAGAPVTTLVSAADVDANGLNGALGLPTNFINASTTENDVIAFSVRPYYESEPNDPLGTEGCGDVMSGFGTNGFAAADWDTDRTTDAGDASFTATELTLTLVDTDNDGVPDNNGDDNNFDRAEASYFVTGTGKLSFDFEYDINDQGFFGIPLDFFIINFEGNTVFRNVTTTEGQFTTGGDGITIDGGSEIVFQLRDIRSRFFDGQGANSTATVSNFAFTPACQPCPGEIVEVEFEVLPALFANFSSAPERVCEGDDATICITGTHDATVTVFLGNGVFNDVKLDDEGNGCFTTVGGLTTDSEFLIMGLTTLDDMPQCSFTFDAADRPAATVMVVPTPTAMISLEPTTVCADDEAIAMVTGTPNATVTYEYNNSPAGTVHLDEDGKGSITLNTENTGTANVVCHVVLTGISVAVGEATCTNELTDHVTLTVRPLPAGTISAGPAVCADGQGTLFFTADPDLLGDYSIEVEDPNGVTLTLTGTSGGAFLTTDIAGTYTLLSITDGTGTDIGCTRTGENLGAAEIIIEEKPNLTAAITGTVGTAHLDSDDEVFNTFRALACDEATINVDFGTSTPSAQALGDLMVNVEVLANDESQANVGSVGTSVIPYTDLNGTNFLDGVLENIADAGITSVEVVLTPFFENGGAAGALEVGEDCSGGTLSFFIDITPAVTLEIEKASSTLVVCEGDAVSIALTGSPNAEVSFSSTGITLDEAFEDGMIDLDGAGNATITGTADGAGMASVTIDMVMVTTIKPEFGISRQCMLMDADEVDITINEVPEAELSVEPAGPICNGETVDVIVTLVNTTSDAGDLFTFVVDGVTYEDIAVDEDGKATLFTSDDLTVTTSFELTSVTNQATDCSNTSDPLSMTTVMVEEVPAGEVTVTIEGEVTTVSEGVSAEFQICANERVDVAASDTNDAHPLVGEDYVSVDFSISEDIDFFSLGQSGTVALPIGDFEAQFSREYNMISGNQVTIELAVTYYNETDGPEGATLDSDECVGITDNITIVINPNPKTEDRMTTTCSGVALDYNLDEAITNGVKGATFSYTVASDDVDVSGLDRTVASDANVTDVFDNFSDDVYTIVYTVTPFGTDGEEDCQGNDFTLTVTVNPEPVITAEQMTMACSGDETACIIRTDNFDTGNISSGEPLSDVIFTLVDVAYSEDFSENFGPVLNEDGESDNAMVGDEGDWLLIAADAFFNTTSENVTVTYTISPVSSEEDGSCAGEEETIVVVIKPEAVVANTLIKVCSNNIFEIDIIEELTANGVGDVISFERRSLDGQNGTLAAYDRGEDFDTEGFAAAGRYNFFGPNGEASNGFNGEALTFNDGVIRDSLVNFIDNGPVDIFYDITIANATDGTGEVCEGNSFVLRVQVLAPREATLSLADGTSAICAGMPIQLNTSFNGTGTPTYEYDVIEADDGVEITLVASASGGEVSVDGTGEGNATILVMVTDDLGCVAMGTRVVSVGNPPEVMEIEGPSAPCTGTTSFYDVANTDGSTYEWSLSDPTAGTFIPDNTTASVDIVFSAGAGPVTLSVTETNALGCSTTSTVEVSPVDQTFSDYTFELEEGTRTVAFTEAAGGSIEGYQWMYNDGTDDVIISNDPNPTFTFPGTEDSYEVTLMVAGGCTVSADGIATITKTVSLNPDLVQDVIQLERGTNFISFDVEFSDRNMNMVFSGVQGLQSVSTFEGGAAKLYEPSRPPFANSLKTVKDDYGYVVVVDQAQTMTVSGLPLSPSYQRPLDDGINYVGHSGPGSTSSDDRLSDMESAGELVVARTFGRNLANLPAPDNRLTQSYVPNRPVFAQSLKNFYNGIGYSVVTNAVVDGEARETESESYDFVFGTVEGVDLDAPVEILDASGNVVGTIITNPDGTFAATPLYGKVERPDGSIVGAFDLDEAVSFRYGDQVINSDVVFRGEFGGQRIDLNFGETETSVSAPELTTSVFPNPAGQQATVSIITTEEMNLQVVAMDIQGRVVTTLMSNQKVPAGTTSIDWMGISELPAGIYHVVFTSDGVMLSQATQRVIKR